MKKVIFVLLAIVLSGVLFFLLKNSQDKPLEQTQVVSEKHEDKVVKTTPVLQTEKPKVSVVKNKEKPTIKPFTAKSILQKKDISDKVNEDFYVQKRVNSVLSEFQNTLPKMIEEIKKIPECLENAKTIEEAFDCHTLVGAMNDRLSMVLGINEVEQNNSRIDFVWDNGTKMEMIEEVKNRLSSLLETQTCMEAVSTASEIDACLNIKENQ